MKKILYIMLCLLSQCFWAQSAFDKGNDYYRKDQFDAAVEAYENVLKTGQHSPELYFNLGNAYYKLNKTAPSIYNYEKALLLKPNYEDAKNNLKFAKNRTIDEIKEIPKVGFEKLIHNFTASWSYDSWAWIAVVFAFVFLFVFAGYYFSQHTLFKRLFFAGMSIALLCGAIAVSAAYFEHSEYVNDRPAIVYAEILPVKGEPKTAAADSFLLHEGTKVNVVQELQGWKKIELTDGSQGWVESASIKELK
ncbi:tetratricopeptide repeat protein [Flavobacterium kingsejongi]|uniref:BatE protein n=1 Tax=Flavobacterium kingsejongi TaxID=1678728 RepID=A0A2S1LL60_9FLAO|nr:tetratricopeptide repeat protein [Flavobacterium kingsejongi]AWG24439.1 BatE protein [Flavobacterium kingsejongi]